MRDGIYRNKDSLVSGNNSEDCLGDTTMAIVFCRSCKGKITQRDTTCPRCGAPTSRLVPIAMFIVICAAAVVLFAVFKESQKGDDPTVANTDKSSERAKTEIVRTVQSDD